MPLALLVFSQLVNCVISKFYQSKFTSMTDGDSKSEARIVDAADYSQVPGTVHLLELQGIGSVSKGDSDVVLVPRPSSDPNDPLNWARWRKLLNIFCVYFYTFSTGVGGTSTYSILTEISDNTGITLDELNRGTGFVFLLAGWGNLIWQPFALTYGRRPTYLLSILGCLAMSEWAAYIGSYSQWAACRCLYGLMTAPVEVLPELNVAELFFAHERGTYVGIYMLVLATSNYLAPLIAGFMSNTYGWRWVQHWSALLLALNFALTFFFYEDTIYERNTTEFDQVPSDEEKGNPVTVIKKGTKYIDCSIPIKSYWKRLYLFSNNPAKVTAKQFLIMAVRPVYIFFAFPAIAFCGFYYGWALVWYNVYNATASAVFSAPPYNWGSLTVGLSYLAPTIGALIGGVYSGVFSDWFTLKMAKRNGGVREPEFRLWGLLGYSIIAPAGLILWGVGAAHSIKWGGLMVGGAMVAFCNVVGGSYSIAYCVDVYKDIAGESLVAVVFCRNTLSFALNYAITPWIDHSGYQNTFIVVAILAMIFGLTCLPMIWKGKSLRKSSTNRYWRLVETQVIHTEH